MTKNEFIKKAKSIHGNKYNYEYIPDNINLKEKIILECIHGKFEKLSSCHLYKKSGCSKCHHDKINPKSNDFFKNCKIKHSSLYIYDEKSFISMKKPIVFYCKIHGINNQMAYNHLNGQGCNKCAKNKRNLTTEDFIKKSIEIHKDKYNYSNSIYINTKTKIEIICKEHGSFLQTPNNHLSKKKGCPKCNGGIKYTIQEIKDKFIKIHGDKYDYSNLRYEDKYLIFNCKIHGEIKQLLGSHLNGSDCKLCKNEESKITNEKFIKDCKEIHGNKIEIISEYKGSNKIIKNIIKLLEI